MKRGATFLALFFLSFWVSGYYADCDTAPPEDSVLVSFEVLEDWGDGYQARITLTNYADWTLEDWVLEFDLESQVDDLLDDTVSIEGAGHYRVTPADSVAADLSPGETVAFDFVGSPGGNVNVPAAGLLNGYPIEFNAYSPAPPPSSSTPPGNWPARVLAPYVDATAWPTYDFVGTAEETGQAYYTLGFIVANGSACEPSWGGYYDMDSEFLEDEIEALRAAGGDVILSFGGAANTELAIACTSDAGLEQAYQKAIDAYHATRVDFDIEGAWVAEPQSIARRARAIAGLQADARDRGESLEVWFTLPAAPDGLTPDGLNLIAELLEAGVDLGGVNLMTMDFGASAGSDPDMGALSISAAMAAHDQLLDLYGTTSGTTDSEALWQRIGITPMIGVNDVTTEVFTLDDAGEVVDFARDVDLGFLAYWSANRDAPCEGGATGEVSSTCSGIDQEPLSFLDVFLDFLP